MASHICMFVCLSVWNTIETGRRIVNPACTPWKQLAFTYAKFGNHRKIEHDERRVAERARCRRRRWWNMCTSQNMRSFSFLHIYFVSWHRHGQQAWRRRCGLFALWKKWMEWCVLHILQHIRKYIVYRLCYVRVFRERTYIRLFGSLEAMFYEQYTLRSILILMGDYDSQDHLYYCRVTYFLPNESCFFTTISPEIK